MNKLLNNFASTLAAGISDTDTTIVINHGLPALGLNEYYTLTLFDKVGVQELNWEIVKVINTGPVGGATLTVERGQEGTTPRVFASGTKVEMRLTAKALTDLQALEALVYAAL